MNDPERLSAMIKERIIDSILKSELNMESVPDDLERKLYENIFDILEDQVTKTTCCVWKKCLKK